ncbi:MAG: hypothetical protein JWP06_633 [Candidatus Saccharibacteria bacterium]|nr:hypothetical protein [Candidatus Saccharibacteria bacterium]
MDDDSLRKQALQWVRDNKTRLFDEVIVESNYQPETDEYPPAASFMAGTPGAGKTEVSKRFLEKFTATPIRIDADDFRQKIPGYSGANSHIIQPAAALAVDKILEKIFDKKYSFMLDGTFAIGKAVENLKRADRRDYSLQIFFVYQDPVQAWEFTKIRQKTEGRYVPKEIFINSYFAARENVLKAKELFGDKLTLFLIIKDYVNGTETIYDDVNDIDQYLPKVYNREQLGEIIL